jgi:hypothetical protein
VTIVRGLGCFEDLTESSSEPIEIVQTEAEESQGTGDGGSAEGSIIDPIEALRALRQL